MNIVLVGGGSGGPVTPLLAIAEEIKKTHAAARFDFIGTAHGPEKQMAEQAGIPFFTVPAGKLRRYFSLKNAATPFLVIAGFLKSLALLKKLRPNCVVGAGAFVQVPVMWAAWVLRIPVLLHQQDIWPSLANRCCSPIASKITVTFEQSLRDFPESLGLFYKKPAGKVLWTGNPFRESLAGYTREAGVKKFNLDAGLPVVYVTGGGTGAAGLNDLIVSALPELAQFAQIIHSTGKQRSKKAAHARYRDYEFIAEPGLAYAAADIVISRAGLSTITELSNLAKISIIIPMPDSHQEYNAEYVAEKKAAIVLHQSDCTPESLVKIIRKLLFNRELQQQLVKNIKGIMPGSSSGKIAEQVCALAEE